MRAKRIAAAGLLALSTAGCETLFGPGDTSRPLERLPRELSAAEREVIESSNAFAFGILRETAARDESGGIILSPLSASMALGMTLNGARGSTFDGMRDGLGFGGLDQAAISESYRSLMDLLLGLDRSVEMNIGNSVWMRSGFPFHSSFTDDVRAAFDAEVSNIDFGAPDAAQTINAWVERSTKGRIPDIVPDPLPADAVMYLINAIYFKGEWQEQFDPRRTTPAPFHNADGSTSTVPMMSRSKGTHYYADAEIEIAELRYGRGAFVMDIVLPRTGSVRNLAASLDDLTWRRWTSGVAESEIHLSMPKFELEYETVMNDALVALGMGDAFSGNADFTGMSPRGNELHISEVRQKTFISVDEEGTEAAAATSVGIERVSLPPTMVVDRPFIVAIRERFSGAILFLGIVEAVEG